MTLSGPSDRGEGSSAESPPRSRVSSRVSGERECSFVDLTTSSEADSGSRQPSRMSPPRQPSPPGDTTSDTEDKSESARRVTLESLECLLHFQASQRELELAELARLIAFSLARSAVPSDRAQRDALLSAASIHELGDALRHPFAGPDSSAVITDMRSELQVAQQINSSLTRRLDTQSAELADLRSQLNIMTLERDRLLDLSKQSTAFTASLRKSVAELEAQAAVARSQADAHVATAFRHVDGFKRQVQDRDQEIAALRVPIADRDCAYADLQGVASKHFVQLQESARLLVDGGIQPLRHAQSVIAHQRAVILRQKRVIARQGSIPMHDPHMTAAAAGRLDAPGLSPSDLQLKARLCRILAERFPEAMDIPSGETQVLELRIGSRQDGALTVPPGSTSPRQASERTARPSSIGLAASDVDSAGGSSQPRRTLAQLHRAQLNTLTPAEKLHRLSHPVSATAAGCRRKPHQPPEQPYSIPLPGEEGHEKLLELLAGADFGAVFDRDVVAATSSTTVTTVVSAAPTVDSAVVFCSAPQDSSVSMATSSSAATASSSAVLVSTSSCSTESGSGDSSVPTSLPMASSAVGLSASCSTASTIGLASSAGLNVSTSILLLAPFPTSGVVTSAPSSAGPVVASAPVLSSTLTPTPLSSTPLVASSTASSTVMSIPASSSAIITAPMTSSAAVALPAAGSVGVSTSAPGSVDSISVSTPNSAMLRVLACSRRTPALKPSGTAPTVVTADPEVSLTSTRPTVPVSDSVMVSPSGRPRRTSAAIAASLSSHYLTELSVSDRVALGLGGSAKSSSDSTSRGAGSSTKPLELLSGASDAESDSVAASSAEHESSRGQTGDPGDQAITAPHPKARALSFATPALDGDDSSYDSDDISLRDLVSRMQTGRVATHGEAQSYSVLARTPPSSPRSSDSVGALSVQWSSSFPKKTKEKKERRKHKHRHKHKHQSKHQHKAFADVYNPDHSSQLLRRLLLASPIFVSPLRLSEAWTRLGNSANASSLMERLAELWVKLRGGIPSPTKPGNSASLARGDHPTRYYFVALWECNHWVVESSVMMGLHPSQQASSSYEEIADMYAKWFQYKLCLPVYPLVNLSWIPGGSDWCQAVSEVDGAEPWRTWWLTDPARHPYNACFRARNVGFLPFAPPGVDPNIVEAAVEDDVDLNEPDPPIRSTSAPPCANRVGIHIFEGCGPGKLGWSASDSVATARSARDARNGSDGSPSDSIFGPDSPDLAGSLSSALGSSVGTSSQVSSSAGQHSQTGNSAGHSVQDQDSAIDMLVNAGSAISQAPSPNAPVTL
ncbi:unnamed protein product [Phytophthora fragariaefolia]|uniref:Unnamed protein product n=1 Tax=Phytophthora fragariaefolia TaxID=1490495 RepID=A0A9W7CXN1_9STRA|nr:unnamed protein product [Phytophthora fragariaefolia]